MQGKVSMVMACYNKEQYIGEMFDSIIAQDWDNIELILVNDGSTDGTRGIIAEYEPKFRARGFEVVILDQKNAGVCAAAKAGLELVTGDYVCVVDSDDELDPKYVSTMAGWLEENPEYDFTACESVSYTGSGGKKVFTPFQSQEISGDDTFLTKRYIFRKFCAAVWIYMVRIQYLRKCRIAETYYTETKGTHEPAFVIPLLSFGGRLKVLPLPLYHFNTNGEGHSRSDQFERHQRFIEEYDKLRKIAINNLPDAIADRAKKETLTKASVISKNIYLFQRSESLPDGQEHTERIFNQLLNSVNSLLSLNPPIIWEETNASKRIFSDAIPNFMIKEKRKVINAPKGRIIGYGASGEASSKLLPYFKGTMLEPTELWDAAGDGVTIKKPDFSALDENDLVLVFPIRKVEAELRERFKAAPFMAMYNSEIRDWLAGEYFGEYMKG